MEENIFMKSEQVEVDSKPNGNNCNGHYRSIQAGGQGHWNGDGCKCGETVSISFIVPFLIIGMLAILYKFKNKLNYF